ncbi:hypothetical protein IFR05_002483 [Cadophora sp. M221]|nr:hypothetical protein IFR05_002483 [Cadophora sp. M221]
MSAHGSEVQVLKWQNTAQVVRNIFIHQGQSIKSRESQPDQSQPAYAFRNKHDQLYSTTQLSEAIASVSQKHCGQRLTVSSYRQVVAAIAKRELVATATAPATADPAFASIALQFGHQPQVLDTAYGLDRSYPAKLQPELMAQYQRISACWHQWLQLPDLEHSSGHATIAVVQAAAISRSDIQCSGKNSGSDTDDPGAMIKAEVRKWLEEDEKTQSTPEATEEMLKVEAGIDRLIQLEIEEEGRLDEFYKARKRWHSKKGVPQDDRNLFGDEDEVWVE